MTRRAWAATVLFAVGLTACNAATNDTVDSPDGRDDVAFTGGKADSMWGDCETRRVLDFLNQPSTSATVLKAKGIHTRAANNIIKRRDGEDGIAGTDDDHVFTSLEDVDDTYYVGPVAMGELFDVVAGNCVVQATETEVIFSPQPYEDSHLARTAELIDSAKNSLDIAMYSFHDENIFDALKRAHDRGVSIRMIFHPAQEDRLDPDGTWSDRIEKAGIDVRYVNKIMHHKFVIVDGPREPLAQDATDDGILISGSGNWSNGAGTRYDENTAFIYGNSELNMRFQKEFNYLWEHSRDFSNTKSYEYFESAPITDDMIPDDPSVDAVFTSANYKVYQSSRYGWTFSVERGRDTVANTIVDYINQAQDSIWVASGHLRSRPIADALLKKHEENPDMDIRILLDDQEYVSYWAHNEEVNDQEDCLAAAGDSLSKRDKCLDRGYHYSYDTAEAGIPTRFKFYAYRWYYTYAEQMHDKYLIIDGKTVISGSYNLSDNAEHNTMENTIIYHDTGFPDLVSAFHDNFLSMWDAGRDKYQPLIDEIQTASSIPIVFDPMALTWDQVHTLKGEISDNCPDVNSQDYRNNPERHFVCYKN